MWEGGGASKERREGKSRCLKGREGPEGWVWGGCGSRKTAATAGAGAAEGKKTGIFLWVKGFPYRDQSLILSRAPAAHRDPGNIPGLLSQIGISDPFQDP